MPGPATLLKKRLWRRCELCEISKNTFFIEHLPATASDFLYMAHHEQKLSLLCLRISTRMLLHKVNICAKFFSSGFYAKTSTAKIRISAQGIYQTYRKLGNIIISCMQVYGADKLILR